MKKLLIATSIAFALTLTAAHNASAAKTNEANSATELKAQEQKNGLIGFGSGAFAGAFVGGPLGAMIGGIFGVFIADDVNSDAEINHTNNELAKAEYGLEQKQQSLVALRSELQDLQEQQMVQLVSYEQQSSDNWLDNLTHFETNLQFKTASFSVEDTYKAQLDSLAGILTRYPQLTIKVTGYADQRGDYDYNQQLSQQRADAVAAYLSDKNVDTRQIKIIAAGEESLGTITPTAAKVRALDSGAASTPKVNVENLFFSRRVNISLLTPKEQMTAAN